MPRPPITWLALLCLTGAAHAEHPRARADRWARVEPAAGPTLRAWAPTVGCVLRHIVGGPSLTPGRHAGTPAAVLDARAQALEGPTVRRRLRIAGRHGWALWHRGGVVFAFAHRGGTVTLSAADADPELLGRFKRMLRDLLPTDDDGHQTWFAAAAGHHPPNWMQQATAADAYALAAQPTPGWVDRLRSALAPLAATAPGCLLDGVGHWHPDVRRTTLALLAPRLVPAVRGAALRRALADADLLVRREASRQALAHMDADGLTGLLEGLTGSGSAITLRGAEQLLWDWPDGRRAAVRALAAGDHTPATRRVMIDWLGRWGGSAGRAVLRRWSGERDRPLARAALARLLELGDPRALARARQAVARFAVVDPLLDHDRAIDALGHHAPPADRRWLERVWRQLEDRPDRAALTARLAPLVDHVRRLRSSTRPAEERTQLAAQLGTLMAPAWMLPRHQRLCPRRSGPAAGEPLVQLRLPVGLAPLYALRAPLARLTETRPERWRQTLDDLAGRWLPRGANALLSVGAIRDGAGLDSDAPIEALSWRPADGRPFARWLGRRYPYPIGLTIGVVDPRLARAAIARALPEGLAPAAHRWRALTGDQADRATLHLADDRRLALRQLQTGDRVRLALGPDQPTLDDLRLTRPATAVPTPAPTAIATLHLALFRLLEPLQLGEFSARVMPQFKDRQTRLVAQLLREPRRLKATLEIGPLPERLGAVVRNIPLQRLQAPRQLLPQTTRAALLVGLDPGKMKDMIPGWRISRINPGDFVGKGAELAQAKRLVLMLRAEGGAAWIPGPDGTPLAVLFVEVDPALARAELKDHFPDPLTHRGVALHRGGDLHARLVGRFLCLAWQPDALLGLGRKPFLETNPRWRRWSRTHDCVYAFVDGPGWAAGNALLEPLARVGPAFGWLHHTGGALAGEIGHADPLPGPRK